MTQSWAESPIVKLFASPILILVGMAITLYFTVQAQGRDIQINSVNIASNTETLATIAAEIPLIRQALERDSELITVVISGIKEGLEDNRDAYEALEIRVRALEIK